jgi:hypothetical protein
MQLLCDAMIEQQAVMSDGFVYLLRLVLSVWWALGIFSLLGARAVGCLRGFILHYKYACRKTSRTPKLTGAKKISWLCRCSKSVQVICKRNLQIEALVIVICHLCSIFSCIRPRLRSGQSRWPWESSWGSQWRHKFPMRSVEQSDICWACSGRNPNLGSDCI